MPVPQELSFPVGWALIARPGLLTRVQDVTAAKFNANFRPRRRCKSDRQVDFRFGILDFRLGIKETGFLAVNAGCNEVSGKKTRFLTTRA